jgi:hypothetical protein
MESSRKIERLDDAFLFMISLIGLLFTIIQIYMEGISGLIEISPLIFLGVLLPFYIGYLRGAIAIDSVIERIRGWVYLAVGVSTYLAFFLARIDSILYWFFIVLAFFSTYYLERWFSTIFEIGDNISNLYAYFGTIISGFAFAFISRMLISLYSDLQSRPPYSFLLLFMIWVTYSALVITVIFEKLSRAVISVQLPLRQEEMEVRRRIFSSFRLFFSGFFIFGFELLSITFELDMRIAFFWFQTLVFVFIGCFLGAAGVPIITDICIITSMIFTTCGIYFFLKIKEIDFSKIRVHLTIVRN